MALVRGTDKIISLACLLPRESAKELLLASSSSCKNEHQHLKSWVRRENPMWKGTCWPQVYHKPANPFTADNLTSLWHKCGRQTE